MVFVAIDWPAWLALQDQRIRSAEARRVVTELKRINLKKVPRKHVASVADIGRRLSLSHWMLRLLTPYIRPAQKLAVQASALERALYAVALARIGAHTEAVRWILGIDDESKEVLILKASAWISQWNYRMAQSIYSTLLRLTTLTEYERRIAEINFAACCVNQGNYFLAVKRLSSFSIWKDQFPLLYGNSCELLAQAYFGIEKFHEAEQMAIESTKILGAGAEAYSLFAQKWLLIIQSSASGQIAEDQWGKVKQAALQRNDGEAQRDLELFRAVIERNLDGFLKVYFGSPFPTYRRIALKRYKSPVSLPSSLVVSSSAEKLTSKLDLHSGVFQNSCGEITIVGKNLDILRVLNRDLFRATPTGELFSLVYPGEVFDVATSPHRVYQAILQLKICLETYKIPIQIERAKHLYRLKAESIAITVYQKYSNQSRREIAITENLAAWFSQRGHGHFQRADLEKKFSLSKSTAIEWLKIGQALKLIESRSAGNRSFYFPLAKASKIIDGKKRAA